MLLYIPYLGKHVHEPHQSEVAVKTSHSLHSNPKFSNTMQCNAMQCNVMQCNAMRCDAMRCQARLYFDISHCPCPCFLIPWHLLSCRVSLALLCHSHYVVLWRVLCHVESSPCHALCHMAWWADMFGRWINLNRIELNWIEIELNWIEFVRKCESSS